MKKIGVVSDVNYNENLNCYNNYVLMNSITISSYNYEKNILEYTKIEYKDKIYNTKFDKILFLGDIVEFDIQTKEINKIDNNISKEDMSEIKKISDKFMKIIEILEEDSFEEAIAKCSNINEVLQMTNILKRKNQFEQKLEKIRIKSILCGMSDNLKSIVELDPNILLTKKSNLENIKSIIVKLDYSTNKVFDKIKKSKQISQSDLNKLYILYIMCKKYDNIWKSSHDTSLFKEINLDNIWEFLSKNLLIIEEKPKVLTKTM